MNHHMTGIIRSRLHIVINLVGNHSLVNNASNEINSIIKNNFKFYLADNFKIETLDKHNNFDLIHNTNRTILTSKANIIINNCDLLPAEDVLSLNKSIIKLSNMTWQPYVFYINSNQTKTKDYLRSLEKNYLVNQIYNVDDDYNTKKDYIHCYLR